MANSASGTPSCDAGGPKNKGEVRYEEGIWLGLKANSDEPLIGTARGVIRARSVKRKAEGEQWDARAIEEMTGTRERPTPSDDSDHINGGIVGGNRSDTNANRANGGNGNDGRREATP